MNVMEPRFDKSKFRKGSVEEMDNVRSHWLCKTPSERLEAAYYLILRAYGYHPDHPPRMNKTVFSKRVHKS